MWEETPMTRITRCIAVAALVGALGATSARADGVNQSDPNLPPAGQYLLPSQVHAMYHGGALNIVLSNVKHQPFRGTVKNKNTSVGGHNAVIESFQTRLIGDVSVNGSTPMPFTLMGPAMILISGPNGYNVGDTGTFNTQMTSLNLSGSVGGHSVDIQIDPNTATTGSTTISDIGGGMFHINSFFDVFTDISLDHGPFIPSSGASHVSVQPGPEPSTFVLAGLGALGLLACARRRGTRRA
jgi:hypothetical protein